MPNSDKQLEYMQEFLINIAGGNFDAKLSIANEKNEELVAMQVGINMLVEELKTSTISRVFLNSIYDGIDDILIVLNEKGEIQKTNHLVETLLFYSESELINLSIEKLIQIDDFKIVKDHIKSAYKKNNVQGVGLNFITKNRSALPVSCSFSTLYNKQHEPSGVLVVAKNMTALLEAKHQLQDKNDELNLFVYKASHDLKSPVSSIQGIMNLARKSDDLSELKMYCKLIDESAKKLETILSDLLILGKITYAELKFESIDIKTVLDDILKSFEFLEGAKDIRFKINVDDKAKSIRTEKGLSHTILSNIIDNAIKYKQKRAEPSYINIDVSNHDNGVLFTIEDNGIGIEESLQKNIFKMFYRATYESKGSGLGLYIVKMSVLKLGGNVSFESSLAKGSTFKIYLPSHSS